MSGFETGSMDDASVYADAMMVSQRSKGHALWNPQPPDGVRVERGDGGYLYAGQFWCLFNIASNDPLHNPLYPDVFNARQGGLDLPPNTSYEREWLSEGCDRLEWQANASVGAGLPVSVGFAISSSHASRRAAALVTPDNSDTVGWRRDVVERWVTPSRWKRLSDFVATHHEEPHKTHSKEIFIVHGLTRTSCWHVTAVESDTAEGTFSAQVQFSHLGQLGGSRAAQTQHSSQPRNQWGPQPSRSFGDDPQSVGELPTIVPLPPPGSLPNSPVSGPSLTERIVSFLSRQAPPKDAATLFAENLRKHAPMHPDGTPRLNQTTFIQRIKIDEGSIGQQGKDLLHRATDKVRRSMHGKRRDQMDGAATHTDEHSPLQGSQNSRATLQGNRVHDLVLNSHFEPLNILLDYIKENSNVDRSPEYNLNYAVAADEDVALLYEIHDRVVEAECRPDLWVVLDLLMPPVTITSVDSDGVTALKTALSLETEENPLRWKSTQVIICRRSKRSNWTQDGGFAKSLPAPKLVNIRQRLKDEADDSHDAMVHDPLDVILVYLHELGIDASGAVASDEDLLLLTERYLRATGDTSNHDIFSILKILRPPASINDGVVALNLEIEEDPLRWVTNQVLLSAKTETWAPGITASRRPSVSIIDRIPSPSSSSSSSSSPEASPSTSHVYLNYPISPSPEPFYRLQSARHSSLSTRAGSQCSLHRSPSVASSITSLFRELGMMYSVYSRPSSRPGSQSSHRSSSAASGLMRPDSPPHSRPPSRGRSSMSQINLEKWTQEGEIPVVEGSSGTQERIPAARPSPPASRTSFSSLRDAFASLSPSASTSTADPLLPSDSPSALSPNTPGDSSVTTENRNPHIPELSHLSSESPRRGALPDKAGDDRQNFPAGEDLASHVKSTVLNRKPYRCEVPGCNKQFSRHENFFRHMGDHEDGII